MPHVMIVEKDQTLCARLVGVLEDAGWQVSTHGSLLDATRAAVGHDRLDGPGSLAVLADWRGANGLLADEERGRLRALGRQVPIVLMVPGRWGRLLSADDLGTAAILPKPFDEATLLTVLYGAARRAEPLAVATGLAA